MQPTNQLLGVQFRVEIRLVTNAVSHETLLISDFLSHRIALPEAVALQELQRNAGSQFDPELIKVFIEKILEKPLANLQ